MPGVTVRITSPPDNQVSLAGKPIDVRGEVSWEGGGPAPFAALGLSCWESRWNGIAFTQWVHVNDFPLASQPTGDRTAAWSYDVWPYDNQARYMLTAFAYDANNAVVGSSDPLHIRSVG